MTLPDHLQHAADDLALYIVNTRDLYESRALPMVRHLADACARRDLDPATADLAAHGSVTRLVRAGLDHYRRTFRDSETGWLARRDDVQAEAARQIVDHYREHIAETMRETAP